MNLEERLAGYAWMFQAREIDRLEQQYVDRGSAFFSVSGTGHEASAALARWLEPGDWLRPHYRDKALLLARGLPCEEFFRSLFCTETSHSRGRQMSAHFADRQKKILSIPGPVGNNVLSDVGLAAALMASGSKSIVVSSMGDGTTQQGEVLEGFCEAARNHLPLLFLIHDNRLAISVRTAGKTIFSARESKVLGLPVTYVDGADYTACDEAFRRVVDGIRSGSGPAVVVMDCERLSNHTNADDQRVYRTGDEIDQARSRDPLIRFRAEWVRVGESEAMLTTHEEQWRLQVQAAARSVLREPPGGSVEAVWPELSEGAMRLTIPWPESDRSSATALLGGLHGVLRHFLASDPDVFLYGQDIEDPKGDVFGVTKGLSTAFPGRVVNAPLSESTILGTCLGRSLAGQRPVAFIQFADFLPLALNQVISEISTMAWRTAGQFTCPMVVIISAGGYRPGLGPFHAQTMEAYLCHTPGIAVVSPSNAADAAGLLITALRSDGPVFFIYPKSLLNNPLAARDLGSSVESIPLGQASVVRHGDDVTLLGWGNSIPLLVRVAEALQLADVASEVIDLRSLAPWDREAVLASARRTGRLLVVHEDNASCGLAAEILATVAADGGGRSVQVSRVCRPNVPVPCSYSAQLATLPSFERILEAACALLEIQLTWDRPNVGEGDGRFEIKAIGTSPADSRIEVLNWLVKPGDRIEAGDLLVEIEADKAAFEMSAPVSGIVSEIVVQADSTCRVGDVLARVTVSAEFNSDMATPSKQLDPVPRFERRNAGSPEVSETPRLVRALPVIVAIEAGVGTRCVTNADVGPPADLEPSEIQAMTGIDQRWWFDSEQALDDALVAGARRLLDARPSIARRLGRIIVSTGSFERVTPSRACRLLAALSRDYAIFDPASFDFSAACSGYIYGLDLAADYLAGHPEACVLLVTAEFLSSCIDPQDRSTAALFGDGWSISLLAGGALDDLGDPLFTLRSTCCFAQPDSQNHLTVDLDEGIRMNGSQVFREASRLMPKALEASCDKAGLSISELDLIVPHQANQRILDAIARRLGPHKVQVYSHLRNSGNTSSTTIPLALRETMREDKAETVRLIGLTAFGGGYTYAGAVLERCDPSST